MKQYNFIKLSNNKNATQDFIVDLTTMKDIKLRIAILKSQLKKYRLTHVGLYRPTWYYLENTDYSYYCIDTCEFETFDQAREHATKIYNEQFIKMNSNKIDSNKKKNIISFD
jgi:hypothetical protein